MRIGFYRQAAFLSGVFLLAVSLNPGFAQLSEGQQAGDLDDSFGGDGIVAIPIPDPLNSLPDEANAVAVQDDGKIVVAGTSDFTSAQGSQFAVVRLNSDGSLDDSSFGTGGIVTIPIPDPLNSLPDEANAVAVQDDGKIVVSGASDIGSAQGSRFAVVRVFSEDAGNGLPTGPGDGGGGCFIDSARVPW